MAELKKIRVRTATPRDRGLFKKLWKKLMIESFDQGDVVLPTDSNVEIYAQLFDKYTSPDFDLKGVVLFISDVAVLMWGDGDTPFELSAGRPITGWGLYVEPEYRKRGISTKLYHAAFDKSRELGFEVLVGGYLNSNHEGKAALVKAISAYDGTEFQEFMFTILYELPHRFKE